MPKHNYRSTPSFSDRIQFITLGPRDLFLKLLCINYRSFIWGFRKILPGFTAWSSRVRARRAFFLAAHKVPAYSEFLKSNSIGNIPETDKDSYIKAYSTEARCIGGRIPATMTMIDESAGSTGTPYNWVRSMRERRDMHAFISYFATFCFGDKPWITINAFSMGSWATGYNMGLALHRNSIVKNVGPDIAKILNTLKFFGPSHDYLILGYPPFLKILIDTADKEKFPLGKFRLNALVGGEGMSEGLRDYLLKGFQKVYSGYGATDLEIGIAGETPISVAIRRLAWENPTVRHKLFGNDSRLPMLFQYNPLMHYIEVNDNGELIFTITRSSLLSPRIRYNVHDQGGVARYDEMTSILASASINIKDLIIESGSSPLRLPFLWVYGRRDYTISIMGANIYPEDLEQCLYADEYLARITRAYCLSLDESHDGTIRPLFLFEIDDKPTDELNKRFSESIVRRLIDLNADFREAWRESSETMSPKIQLFYLGDGPFKDSSGKVKQTRFIKK